MWCMQATMCKGLWSVRNILIDIFCFVLYIVLVYTPQNPIFFPSRNGIELVFLGTKGGLTRYMKLVANLSEPYVTCFGGSMGALTYIYVYTVADCTVYKWWSLSLTRLMPIKIKRYCYIPEKSPYTLPLKRSCNNFLYWMLNFVYGILTRPRFSANSKGACTLCLCNSIVCFGCVTKVLGHCYMPHRLENGKHWA